ncbi:hypothetical protein [Bradyrhizobium sp.]|jgi:hypothetical protein|uniref:hypothetical protein n=1 Tax=Bradyrhizobium sp. TaxID=376 RepID=UPI003C15404D
MIDRDKMVSPHAQEVQFALLLSRMINTVKQDPSQMRLAIYEFARARLKLDVSSADHAEQERLSAALEGAIRGVEDHTQRYDETARLPAPTAFAQVGFSPAPAEPALTSMIPTHPLNAAPAEVLAPTIVRLRPEVQPVLQLRTRVILSPLVRFYIGALLFGAVASLAIYMQRTNAPSQTAVAAAQPSISPASAVASASLPFPLPSDYGVYALGSDAALSELHALSLRVPDKRVALSTPINEPSHTTLADGKVRFVVFRRDLAASAPDRIEVRVVARVVRALTFDGKGKAGFVPVSNAWNIRNLSHEYRVRPIAGNPEMLLMQAENADFALPAGRYVLVLQDLGYDFTVAGKVTDPSQCLERTDAANGAFYSDCQKK